MHMGRKWLNARALKSNYFRSNNMAQVTYRGVVYDTENRPNKAKTQKVELTYRGVKSEKGFATV